MSKFGILVTFIAIALVSCTNQGKKQDGTLRDSTTINKNMIDPQSSDISLDWIGVYKGTMPCADCEGIETTIELRNDQTYVAHYKYLGEGDANEFIDEGTFTWAVTGSIITLESESETSQYKVEKNRLILLTQEGELNTGELADYYVLKKII